MKTMSGFPGRRWSLSVGFRPSRDNSAASATSHRVAAFALEPRADLLAAAEAGLSPAYRAALGSRLITGLRAVAFACSRMRFMATAQLHVLTGNAPSALGLRRLAAVFRQQLRNPRNAFGEELAADFATQDFRKQRRNRIPQLLLNRSMLAHNLNIVGEGLEAAQLTFAEPPVFPMERTDGRPRLRLNGP